MLALDTEVAAEIDDFLSYPPEENNTTVYAIYWENVWQIETVWEVQRLSNSQVKKKEPTSC